MAGATRPPWQLTSDGGLRALVVDGGALASLGTDALELVQHTASPFEAGLVQLWLRDRAAGTRAPLVGPGSGALVRARHDRVELTGSSDGTALGAGLEWTVVLVLGAGFTWAWHVEVRSTAAEVRELDLVHTHDVALAAPGALRANELYVSQYLDVTPLEREGLAGPGRSVTLAVRQNLPQQGRHPWCVLATDAATQGWASDALDVHGWAARAPHDDVRRGLDGDLPGRRLQHEHTLAALATTTHRLEPGATWRVTFGGLLVEDHPAATRDDDAAHAEEALAAAAATAPWGADAGARPGAADEPPSDAADEPSWRPAPAGRYADDDVLVTRALTEDELRARWPEPWRAVERGDAGAVLSFFGGDDRHVVARGKDLAVLRPHGTILRTGDTAVPDPDSLTVTAWMTGSPLSYLTVGHVSTGRVLTTVRGYLGLHRAHGVRILVEVAGRWRLLDLPSAFATTPGAATWIHAFGPEDDRDPGGVVEVTTTAPPGSHEVRLRVRVTEGPARRVLAALHLATGADPLPAAEGAVRARQVDDRTVQVDVGPTAGSTDDGLDADADADGDVRAGRRLTVIAETPVVLGDDGPLFHDGEGRTPDVVTLLGEAAPGAPLVLRLTAAAHPGSTTERARSSPDGIVPAGDEWWPRMTSLRVEPDHPAAEALAVSLPWLVRDALVHHLAPRGLEQYTGGAWGTRDVTQGPLELLLGLDRPAEARALLLQVLAAQDPDGSWPQAFGFLPGDEHFRMGPPHGDVVHWPVLALGRYLEATGDGSLLSTLVPWYAPADGAAEPPSSVLDHVRRALDHARAGYLPGTHLVTYGHGDWNDSLQPADPDMARTMTSAWTVTLHHQSLQALADGLDAIEELGADEALSAVEELSAVEGLSTGEGSSTGEGRDDDARTTFVAGLRDEATRVAADLHRHLVVDGELAGYALLGTGTGTGTGESIGPRDGTSHGRAGTRLLVHPRDDETGLHHGALQMIHALATDLLDPESAAHHVGIVREHLMGVDGVRLFDRPPGYHGGETRHFQRAETATFVGREIGLMYVHAHLRWVEAMARWGDADAVWLGLQQVLAPAIPDVVPGARRRQSSTYASSSDAAVHDRVEFADRYAEVRTGGAGLEAGWRIYSSGPGVLVRVVAQSVLGIRRRVRHVEIDPVLPALADGLRAQVPLDGGHLHVVYRIGRHGGDETGDGGTPARDTATPPGLTAEPHRLTAEAPGLTAEPQGHGPLRVVVGGRELDAERVPNPYRTGALRVPLEALAPALVPGGPVVEVHLP